MHPDASRVHDRQQTRSFSRSLIDRRSIGLKDGRRRGCANYVPRRKPIFESSDFHPTMHIYIFIKNIYIYIYIYRDFSPPGEKESFNRVLSLPDSFATLFWRKLVELELTWISDSDGFKRVASIWFSRDEKWKMLRIKIYRNYEKILAKMNIL